MGFLVAGGGAFAVGRYVAPQTGAERVLDERLTALAAQSVRDRAGLSAELERAREETRAVRDQLRAEHAAAEYNTQLIAAALRRAGVKLEWEDGSPVPEIDLHPAPLRVGKAPPIQPVAALRRAPQP